MVGVANHGGHCCGVHHIFGFGGKDSAEQAIDRERKTLEKAIADYTPKYNPPTASTPESRIGCTCPSCMALQRRRDEYNEIKGRLKSNEDMTHLFEIILTENQTGSLRLKMLKDLGFRLVTAFVNHNSWNKCYVFHLVTGVCRVEEPPEGWEE